MAVTLCTLMQKIYFNKPNDASCGFITRDLHNSTSKNI